MNRIAIRNAARSASRLLLVAVLAIGGVSVATAQEMVELRWALGALDSDSTTPSAVKKDTELATGTRLKFLVEPLSPSTVYLMLLDSSSEIHLLYRETSQAAEVDGKPTYVPPGSQWFELDDQVGQETFFLLASVEPLPELDALVDRHAAAEGDQRTELGEQIVAEIRRLHRAHRQFSRPIEKPVMIGGQTRGGAAPSTIDQLAVEITAEKFYGKTITIDH